jgi:hypothetical protein
MHTAAYAQRTDHSALILFTLDVLSQAHALAHSFELADEESFPALVGPHLRHIIEHFDALLDGAEQGQVHYDERERDATLERSPRLAMQRLAQARRRFAQWQSTQLLTPMCVYTRGGLEGELRLQTESTAARELVFLTSHAVHHFALLKPACVALGKRLSPSFGKAPATLAFEREQHHRRQHAVAHSHLHFS